MDHNYTDAPVFDSSTPLRFNPRQPPQPNPNNTLVLRFTAAKEAIANANVINHEGSVRYSFTSESEGQMQMHDQVGNKIARVEGGQIFFRNSEGQKLKTFLRKMPSNTYVSLYPHYSICYLTIRYIVSPSLPLMNNYTNGFKRSSMQL